MKSAISIGVTLLSLFALTPKPALAKAKPTPVLQCSKTSLSFANEPLPINKNGSYGTGTTSPQQPVSVLNVGSSTMSLSPETNGDFQIVANAGCSGSLGPGNHCSMGLTFTPTRPGRRTGTLLLTQENDPSACTVKLSGKGVPTRPVITQPSSSQVGVLRNGKVTFRNAVQIGQKSPPFNVIVRNPNAIAVNVNSLAISGPFTQSSTCGSSVAAHGTCQIGLTFEPTSTCNPNGGTETGSLNIVTSAGRSTTVNLVGTALSASPLTAILVTSAYGLVSAYPLGSDGDPSPLVAIGNYLGIEEPTGVALDNKGNVYVAGGLHQPNEPGAVSIFSACSSGTVSPVAAIEGTDLAEPSGVAVDSSGTIYIANYGESSDPYIAIYPPLGNQTGILSEGPTTTISGPDTGLNSPAAIAVDARGNLYVANDGGGVSGTGNIVIYAPGASGDAEPVTIDGADTGLNYPSGVAVDSNGDIYVANCGAPPMFPPMFPLFKQVFACTTTSANSSVTVYAPGSHGNALPLRTIAGVDAAMDQPNGIGVDSGGNIYLANAGNNSVTIYQPGVAGSSVPSATIFGSNTGLVSPAPLAVGANNTLYVANNSSTEFPPTASLTEYANVEGSSGGDLQPMPTIGGSNAGFQHAGEAISDTNGNLYVTNEFGGATGAGNILIFPPGSNGNVVAPLTIEGPATELALPEHIALDSNGNIYVDNFFGGSNGSGSITVYSPSSHGDVPPIAEIGGPDTLLSSPGQMVLDSQGNIYVANHCGTTCTNPITVFAKGSTGDAPPIAVISGPDTQLTSISGLGVDAAGRIYASDFFDGRIYIYPPISADAAQDVAPLAVITGPDTKLFGPGGIAFDSSGNLYVTNCVATCGGGSIGPDLVTVYSPIGDLPANTTTMLDLTPISTIGGNNTGIYEIGAVSIGTIVP